MHATSDQTRRAFLETLAARHEPFRPVIERFGRVLLAQLELRDSLPSLAFPNLKAHEQAFLSGESVVFGVDPEAFRPLFTAAAQILWPLLAEIFPPFTEPVPRLLDILQTNAQWSGLALRAVVHGDGDALAQAADLAAVTPDVLFSALQTAYGPCIGAQKTLLAELPGDLWRHAHCPRCGSAPDMASLEVEVDPSEFLISKSGQFWHHCPVCSAHWRFVRMVCPGCANQDHDSMVRLTSPDLDHEMIYACEKCKQYLPCVDMVEGPRAIDLDLMALGLVHLDAVAQSRGYVPLSPAPWTAFGFAQEQVKAS